MVKPEILPEESFEKIQANRLGDLMEDVHNDIAHSLIFGNRMKKIEIDRILWQGPADDCHAGWKGYELTVYARRDIRAHGFYKRGWIMKDPEGELTVEIPRTMTGAEARAAAERAAREDKETR